MNNSNNFEIIYFTKPQSYEDIYKLQIERVEAVANETACECLMLLEHLPVYTAGRHFKPQHLLITPEECNSKGIQFVNTDRGGDITYHGPGQLVGYPIISLTRRNLTVHKYLRTLEQTIIECLKYYQIEAKTNPPLTGVWVEHRKICAIGIGVRKGITYHGFSLNVNLSLEPYKWIIPCGISDKPVTSLSQEISSSKDTPSITDVINILISVFINTFELNNSKITKVE